MSQTDDLIIPIPENKDIICQGGALNFAKAQPSSKQLNPKGLGDADGTKGSGCPTPADMILFLGNGITGTVESLSFGGDGIIKHQGLVLFVPFTAPSDKVLVQIVKQKKNYAKAKVLEILEDSPLRVAPKCLYFGTCGGCQLQHLNQTSEIKEKRQWIEDSFNRIGHLKDIVVKAVIPSPKQYAYRRHISLSLKKTDESKVIAGYVTADNSSVFQVNECPIFIEKQNSLLKEIQLLVKNFDMKEDRAKLTVLKDGENDFILHFHFEYLPRNAKNEVESFLKGQTQIKNIILGSKEKTFSFGKTTSSLTLDGLNFTFSSDVFMQNNPEQSLNIYRHIEMLAKKESVDEILDLYCGIGISSLLLGKSGIKVTGIESNHHSIKMAKKNAQENNLSHVTFKHAAVENVLTGMKIPEFVIINPPREGLDPRVIEALKTALPKRMVYISCMPTTLARDLNLLKDYYQVEECQPYDMFPQTTHVETLVSLVLIP